MAIAILGAESADGIGIRTPRAKETAAMTRHACERNSRELNRDVEGTAERSYGRQAPTLLHCAHHGDGIVLIRRFVLCLLLAMGVPTSLSVFGATLSVTNSAASGPGTLKEAISIANTSAPPNTITFNISGTPTISMGATALPDVVNTMTIDGTTQPGYSNSFPKIWLQTLSTFGFRITFATNVVLRGLKVSGASSSGIQLDGGSSNRVEACQIISNTAGISVAEYSCWNLIGGYASSNKNIVSGSTSGSGIGLYDGTHDNVVAGNWIGVDPTNTAARMPNARCGIMLQNASNNTILGSASAPQLVSGNGSYGIEVYLPQAAGNSIRGNFIGTDLIGSTAVSNGAAGIWVSGAPATTIGGTNAADRNVISGNGSSGIKIDVATATGTVIRGNYIGVSAFGSQGLANLGNGVEVWAGAGVSIGGPQSAAGNVISGNRGSGIYAIGSGYAGAIQGNIIGLNSTAAGSISNTSDGVTLSVSGWHVGGTNAAARNIIGGNGGDGVNLDHGASANVIEGNLIGLDGNNLARPNGRGVFMGTAADNCIGGTTVASRNIIAGNRGEGVYFGINSGANDVWGNYIGVAANGAALSNGSYGIYGAATNGLIAIGGTLPGQGNVISGNGNAGVYFGLSAVGNILAGNLIGLNPSGTAAIPNHGVAGASLSGDGHVIENNVISGNSGDGIDIYGNGCQLTGNIIGLSSNGLNLVTNAGDGLVIEGSNNVVGGTSATSRNVIGGNETGIGLYGVDTMRNTVIGNYIGIGANGTNRVPNRANGLEIDTGALNTIGGLTLGERNVIEAIFLRTAEQNTIQGNYIGADAQGVEITNVVDGIVVNGGLSNMIGGSIQGSGNMIGGYTAIEILGSTANTIHGNCIGVRPDGSRLHYGANNDGIYVVDSTGNTVGGTNSGDGNVIAYYDTGVDMASSNKNAILGNSIYSNALMGIDLNSDGTGNANDPLDADTGANDLQNHPTITNLMSLAGSVWVRGYLSSKARQTYRLEFFENDSYRSGGEGKRFLGTIACATAMNGTGVFSVVLSGTATGKYVTATATDSGNNTSEMYPYGSKATVAPDTDHDGMPDFWETQYGLDPASSNAPSADQDNDGMSDYAEYVADTSPIDGDSDFRISSFDSQSGYQVTFMSSAVRVYDLVYMPAVGGPTNWITVLTNQLGNGKTLTLPDSCTNRTGVYRVKVRIP